MAIPGVYQTKDDNSNNKKIVEKVPTDGGDGSKEAKKMLAISDRTRSSSVSDNNWKRSLRKEKQGEMLLPAIRNPARNRMAGRIDRSESRQQNNNNNYHTTNGTLHRPEDYVDLEASSTLPRYAH